MLTLSVRVTLHINGELLKFTLDASCIIYNDIEWPLTFLLEQTSSFMELLGVQCNFRD